MSLVNVFGVVASITSIIGLMPQIYKTYKTKSAKDVSMLMLVNFLICSMAWIGYGTLTDAYFVVFSNIVGLITGLVSILQKRHYDAC